MKKLNVFARLIWMVNALFALTLLASSLSSLLPPSELPLLSVFGLLFPFWLLINMVFMIGWMIRLKPHFLLSFLAILLSWKDVAAWIRWAEVHPVNGSSKELSVMSYNVRLFNRLGWIEQDGVPESIARLIDRADPSILCIQEYHKRAATPKLDFPHSYVWTTGARKVFGMSIMSQYPILDTGSVAYGDALTGTLNQRFIWADILVDADTLRIVNAHLSSIKLRNSDIEVVQGHLPTDDPDGLKKEVWQIGGRIQRALVQHGQQIDVLMAFTENSPHPVIVCADLNETSSGYCHAQLESRLQDSFRQAGKGLGGTYPRIGFPLRIDHIFLDPSLEVRSHKVIREKLSDHYPVQVSFSFR